MIGDSLSSPYRTVNLYRAVYRIWGWGGGGGGNYASQNLGGGQRNMGVYRCTETGEGGGGCGYYR